MTPLEETVSSDETYEPIRPPWRALAIAAVVILLVVGAVFLPPLINLGKYKRSITASMSEALGRPVYVGGMQLRLLPMPGIVMSDFTVDEDPAFGYEPALHATSVVAALRLSSLWRGRLEVSRISLDEANLNLVKNSAGEWSLGSVLLRASQIPNAPTGARHVSSRPRFPYIEATNARIDFKDGAEKKPFSLMTAEFSMWQANADEWRLRLKAQPVRTDLQLHLSDTGEVNVEGSLRRAAALDAMPVDLEAEWSGAQLGQVTRLIAGMDSGWRGDLDVTATIRGSLGDLKMQSRVRVGDLRRQEQQPASTVDVDASCRSEYRRGEHTLDNITCFWPVAAGHLLLTGKVQGLAAPKANLQVEINKIPASFPVSILGLMRPAAQNLTVAGIVNGSFALTTEDRPVLTGDALATGVGLRYLGGTMSLPAMHFVAGTPEAAVTGKGKRAGAESGTVENAIELQPMTIPMGEAEPVAVEARFTRAGFEMHVAGIASLARLMPAVANLGLFENAMGVVAPKGRAELNLKTGAEWMRPLAGTSAGVGTTGMATSGIGTVGTVKVEGVQLKPAFLPAPVDVESAEVDLTPEEVAWHDVAFTYQKMPMQGSIRFPVTCNPGVACPARFTLAPGLLNAAAIEGAIGRGGKGFFGQILTNALGEQLSAWPSMAGEIRCDGLELGQVMLRNVAASVSVESNKLTLSSLDATAWGGTLHGSGAMGIADGTPRWNLKVHVAGAGAREVAESFGEQWGSGTMGGDVDLKMSGYRTEDLASSAAGNFSFVWQNGLLAGSGGTEVPLTRFDRWIGKGTIAKSALTLTSGGISREAKTSAVRGSITFDRELNLTVETRRGAVKIGGTLARLVVQ
jgi:AsmA family/AsmA-like C-terminal region